MHYVNYNALLFLCSDTETDDVTLTPEMVNTQFAMIVDKAPPEVAVKAKQEENMSFPYGPRMPANNIPVSQSGPVQR